jgi:UDP-2-acetamido-2,6-beta-L-arabino-hexul-4-ose reductase
MKIIFQFLYNVKIEKFIVINGKVRFNFVNIINKKKFSILSDENKNIVINTFPGWAHNIINISLLYLLMLMYLIFYH